MNSCRLTTSWRLTNGRQQTNGWRTYGRRITYDCSLRWRGFVRTVTARCAGETRNTYGGEVSRWTALVVRRAAYRWTASVVWRSAVAFGKRRLRSLFYRRRVESESLKSLVAVGVAPVD